MTDKIISDAVKVRVGLFGKKDELRESIADSATDEASELITNYINRDEVPSAARMTWIALATDIYKHNVKDFEIGLKDKDAEEGASSGYLENVSEIRIDDAIVRDEITSAKYNRDAAALSVQTKKEMDFLKDYRGRLQRFRLLQWRKWE